jgi:hypothetical protein
MLINEAPQILNPMIFTVDLENMTLARVLLSDDQMIEMRK